MDSLERFDETVLPNEKEFYSKLNLGDVADVDSRHAERVYKKLNNKSLDDHHYLSVQIPYVFDALLLADLFEDFRNKCIEIYKLDPAHFLSAPGLTWQAFFFKKRQE